MAALIGLIAATLDRRVHYLGRQGHELFHYPAPFALRLRTHSNAKAAMAAWAATQIPDSASLVPDIFALSVAAIGSGQACLDYDLFEVQLKQAVLACKPIYAARSSTPKKWQLKLKTHQS